MMFGRMWNVESNGVSAGAIARSLAIVMALVVTAGCGAKKGAGMDGEGGMTDEAMAGRDSMTQFETTGKVASGGPFTDIHFAFDSIEIDSGARAASRQNADYLKQHASVRAEIEGHCDERGTTEYNLALGARRAKAVRDALIALGIAADRLSTVSYGEELPLCKENTQSCWSLNRRAHLVDLTK